MLVTSPSFKPDSYAAYALCMSLNDSYSRPERSAKVDGCRRTDPIPRLRVLGIRGRLEVAKRKLGILWDQCGRRER